MPESFYEIAFTPGVEAAQAAHGSRGFWEEHGPERAFTRFTASEEAFIESRDSFYMASVSETDWPYLQHRGGPPGFLKVLDARTLGFADYRGNRQYISLGNFGSNDRTALFLMDYARRARLKIYARAEILALDADAALTARLIPQGVRAKAERVMRLHLEAFDWNCSQHITPRFTERELAEALTPLRERLAALESENAAMRQRLLDKETENGS